MEKRDYLVLLYDYYEKLLNDKQREYFISYYFDNLSLSEISENLSISRNAVHKSLKNIEKLLLDYENKLGLYKKYTKILETVEDDKLKNEVLDIIRRD